MDCENCRHLTFVGLHDTGPRTRRSRVSVLLLGSLVGCQQHVSVSQGWICSDYCTCCHAEMEVADQTFYLTQSQYTDTGPTSPSADPKTVGAWQGSHWSANFQVTGMTRPRKKKKNPTAKAGIEPRIFRSRDGSLSSFRIYANVNKTSPL